MNSKIYKFIAGGCFGLSAIIRIVIYVLDCIETSFFGINYSSIIFTTGLILSAIGFLLSKHILCTIGFALGGVSCLIDLFHYLPPIYPGYLISCFVIILEMAFYILLLIASVQKNSGKILGIIAASLNGIQIIICIMMGAINIFSLLFILLYVVVAIFSGLTFKNSPKKVVATGKQAVTSPSSVASASDNLDNLLRLKKLLDDEIITQEEFEAKKKEMLNL